MDSLKNIVRDNLNLNLNNIYVTFTEYGSGNVVTHHLSLDDVPDTYKMVDPLMLNVNLPLWKRLNLAIILKLSNMCRLQYCLPVLVGDNECGTYIHYVASEQYKSQYYVILHQEPSQHINRMYIYFLAPKTEVVDNDYWKRFITVDMLNKQIEAVRTKPNPVPIWSFHDLGYELCVTTPIASGGIQTFRIDETKCLNSSENVNLSTNVNKRVVTYLHGGEFINFTTDPNGVVNGITTNVRAFLKILTDTKDINGNRILTVFVNTQFNGNYNRVLIYYYVKKSNLANYAHDLWRQVLPQDTTLPYDAKKRVDLQTNHQEIESLREHYGNVHYPF